MEKLSQNGFDTQADPKFKRTHEQAGNPSWGLGTATVLKLPCPIWLYWAMLDYETLR